MYDRTKVWFVPGQLFLIQKNNSNEKKIFNFWSGDLYGTEF